MLKAPYRTSPLSIRPDMPFALSREQLEITEEGFLGKIQLRGASERFKAVSSEIFGLPSLPPPLRSAALSDLMLLGLGPDEWMVIGSPDRSRKLLPKLNTALEATDAMAVDVGSAFATLRLSGGGSFAILRKGCSVPLERLAVGDCLRTRVGRYYVLIHYCAEGPVLNLHVGRSYARSFRNWIEDAVSL